MAQTGYTAIQLYYTTTVSATPTAGNLAAGELAINTADEKLYFKNSSGVVKLLASTLMVGTNGGTGINNGSRTISYAGNIAFTGAFNPTFAIPSSSTYTFPTGDSTLVSTTGTVAVATAANGLKSSSTTVAVSSATAPSSGQVLTATSSTAAIWQGLLLSNVVAATGPATIANANNAIAWNWAQTTASQTAFTIGETSASTGGSGSQVLCKIGTLASSTADPLQVQALGADVIRVSRLGACTITAGANASTTGSAVSITSGNATGTSGAGGAVSITAGSNTNVNATGNGGAITITAGNGGGSAGSGGGSGGNVTITAGTVGRSTENGGSVYISAGVSGTSTGTGGSVTIAATNGGSSSGNGGAITITAGYAAGAGQFGGSINLTPGVGPTPGRVVFNSSSTANGTVATVLGSVGPTGSNTTVQEWLTIRVGVNLRYIPCF